MRAHVSDSIDRCGALNVASTPTVAKGLGRDARTTAQSLDVRARTHSSLRVAIAVLLVLLAPAISAAAPPQPEPRPLAQPGDADIGGAATFLDPHMRQVAGGGEAWRGRLSAGRPRGVRIEVAYTGADQPLRGMSGSIFQQGVEAGLRINVAPHVAPYEPFFFFGGGWMHFRANAPPEAGLRSTDDVFVMPIGVGVARRFGSFIVALRAGAEVTAGGELLPLPASHSSHDAASMNVFGVFAGVGYRL